MPLGATIHQAVAAWINGSPMPSAPVALRLGLSATDPLEDGTALSEPSGSNGYARQVVTFTATPNPGGGTRLSSAVPVVFGPGANTDSAPMRFGVLFDANGGIITYGPLAAQKTLKVGDTLSYGANAFQFVVR